MAEWKQDRTDGPVKCTWHLGTKEKSPHTHYPSDPRPKICDTVLENIGNTPLIRINKVASDVPCEVLAKCEFFNSGGSVKDRIGKRMVEEAEKSGRIKKGDILIEPTSGNTGIGLALAAAVKGYKCIITMPEKMSLEKIQVLKGLGAEIIRTPTEAAWDSPESHISVAENLRKKLPNAHILDQYINVNNPLAHYDFTGEEIWNQCDGKVDMVVMGTGTGGTLTGIARKLKEKNPKVIIIGVDPHGSILAQPEELNKTPKPYAVEGIGYDFIPTVCDRHPSLIDRWYKVDDKPAFIMARRLIKEEGLLCGGSSGCAMHIAVQAAKDFGLTKDHRVVVILPDGVRNYMTKFLADSWMIEQGFYEAKSEEQQQEDKKWKGATVKDLRLRPAVYIREKQQIQDAILLMQDNNFDQLPVVNDEKKPLGLITVGNLLAKVSSSQVSSSDPVSKAMFSLPDKMATIQLSTPLADLNSSDYFQKAAAGFVTDPHSNQILHVITQLDLYNFLLKRD